MASNSTSAVGFKKQCVCRIHNADLSDAPSTVSPPQEIVSAIREYDADANESHRLKLLSLLNNALAANFVPDNVEGVDLLVSNKADVHAQRVDVIDFRTNGPSFPTITADAVFELTFTADIDDSQLKEWESQNDENLAWCVNFYWKSALVDEHLFLNAGVDGVQLWIEG